LLLLLLAVSAASIGSGAANTTGVDNAANSAYAVRNLDRIIEEDRE
jgi:hypothetical protein